IPDDRAPVVKASETEMTPALYNDPQLTERVAKTLERTLGAENVVQIPPIMASEVFGRYSLDHQILRLLFSFGSVEPTRMAASKQSGKPLPSLHSSLFASLPEPTLRTGVKAMTSVVLDLMKK